MEAFIYACVLAGKVVGAPSQNSTHPHLGSVQVRDSGGRFTSPEKTARIHPGTKCTVHHKGIVWCPTVPLGNWLARDNGHIFYTGNSKPKPLSQRSGSFAKRLSPFDLFLMYDQVALDAWQPYGPKRQAWGVLQGGYEASEWKNFPGRDWFGDRFMFIMSGQLHNRKAPYVAIQAFNELKHEHPDSFSGARLGLHTTIGDPLVIFGDLIPGMKVFHEMWQKSVLEEFYHAAHVLVAPSRGEGKNLPALEMMSTGGAVAATAWGGHMGWLNPEYAYGLGYELTPTDPKHPEWAHDAKVSVEEMKRVMWHCFNNRAEVRDKAELAANIIPRMMDWSVVVESLFRRIRDLVPGKGELLWLKAQACRNQ